MNPNYVTLNTEMFYTQLRCLCQNKDHFYFFNITSFQVYTQFIDTKVFQFHHFNVAYVSFLNMLMIWQ